RFDDLRLRQYRATTDPDSAEIALFSPAKTPAPYFSEFGFIGLPGANVTLPGAASEWRIAEGEVLTPETPVTLIWDNGQGLTFVRRIALDEHFLFTISDSIENRTGQSVTLFPYGLISRTSKPSHSTFFILHEGLIGMSAEDGLREVDYSDIEG